MLHSRADPPTEHESGREADAGPQPVLSCALAAPTTLTAKAVRHAAKAMPAKSTETTTVNARATTLSPSPSPGIGEIEVSVAP